MGRIWQIIEGKVPNISAQSNRQIQTYQHVRHGRLCVVPEPSRAAKTHIKTLVNNSFVVRALKLFNAIPKYIRKITDCDVAAFKNELDVYIRRLPDEPALPGYPATMESNSLLHVIPYVQRQRFQMPRIFSSPPRDAKD